MGEQFHGEKVEEGLEEGLGGEVRGDGEALFGEL